jgi:hypothetical protein
VENLTSLAIQVDEKGQARSFTDANSTWKCVNPLSIIDLVEKYNDLLTENGEGLTSLKIQVDHDGQVHSFTDANSTWIFKEPISIINLLEKYRDVLVNVALELKIKKDPLPKGSRNRSRNRHWPIS